MEQLEPVGLTKTSCSSSRGIVVTKHPIATRIGRETLAAGGNALDAAIAAAFALGVVEPYMSGVGGVGLALVADDRGVVTLDGGPVAPRDLDVDRYRLAPDQTDADLFGWPRVVDDANILGPTSLCVPTMVALMHALYERGATLPWPRLLEPAVELARDGYPVDWLLPLSILQDQDALRSFPSSAAIFFPGGRVPAYDMDVPGGSIFRQPDLARTLETIAADGPQVIYDGPLGEDIARGVRAAGGSLSAADLAAYQVSVSDPVSVHWAGVDVLVTGGLNGGETVADILRRHDALRPEGAAWGTAADLTAWVQAGAQAFRDRLATMGHAADRQLVEQASLGNEGIPEETAAGTPDGSTTYLAIVDQEERVVSMNLTLLSRWGSRFVVPGLGILMNNGIMWFNPVPGHASSLTAGARPLANMVPTITMRGGRPVVALGATGGRRIISALPQILANIMQHGMGTQDAIQAPRLEFSTDPMLADGRFPDAVIREVERNTGLSLKRYIPRLASSGYASPLALLRSSDGSWTAGMDPTGMAASACV